MFFSVARLRRSLLPALFLFSSFARAHQEVLFASSVSYCTPPEEILVDQLDLTYFKANNSIFFNVSAASVLADVNVTANLYLNVYGMQPLNTTIDLCKLFNGIICPLPQYNFTGTDTLSIPSNSITNSIPGIAYVIPDLEAYAQLTLIEVDTNQVKACVQITLSNGWSMRQYAVEWTTAAIALLALVSAIWKSLAEDALALAPIRLLDLLYLFQTIAVSGLLGLNYPSAYTAYSLNFSWVLGLFSQSPTSPMQNSINHMRSLTGGNSQDASSGGAVQYVNRKLSPYNSPSASSFEVSTSVLSRFSSLPQVDLADPRAQSLIATPVGNASTLVSDGGVAIVTSDSTDVLQAGIPIYVNTIGVATADAFMTIFLVALIYAAIVLAALALGYFLYFYANRRTWGKRCISCLPGLQAGYLPFARAWSLRAALITVLPITVFVFYQWTLKDSWLSVLLSVFALVIIMALVFPSLWPVFRGVLRRSNQNVPSSLSLAPLVSPFRQERIYYIIILLLAIVAKAMITAFGHAHGLVQSILCLIVEIVLLVSLIILKPYRTRHADILQGFLSIVRVVCSGLFIAFAESLALMAIPRTAIGIVAAVIFSVAVLVMFFNILVNLGLWRLVTNALCCGKRRREGARALTSKDSNFLFGKEDHRDAEKGQDSSETTPGSSQFFLVRPGNPTPPATDVGALTPISVNSEQPSMFSSGTTTSTLGETLPRRWSFQHSRPPSSTELSPTTGGSSVTPSPSTPSSRLPSQRHSRHPSSSAPAPIAEHQLAEENAS